MALDWKLYFSGWLAGWPTVIIMLFNPAGAWAELGKMMTSKHKNTTKIKATKKRKAD